jgi:hypothetical protein
MHSAFARLLVAAFCLAALPGPAAYGQAVPKPRPSVTEPPPTAKPAPAAKTGAAKTGAAKTDTAKADPGKRDHGTVYLIRGLADVFSLGMNTLGEKLRANGVKATVVSQSYDRRTTEQIEAAYKRDKTKAVPIIIMGHSLGANKALVIASRLGKKGIPVRLVVLFDATHKIPVSTNVQEVLNLHKPSAFGVKVSGAEGYAGTIDNHDVSDIKGIGHVSIDKSKVLHAEVVEKVLQVLAEDEQPQPKKKK